MYDTIISVLEQEEKWRRNAGQITDNRQGPNIALNCLLLVSFFFPNQSKLVGPGFGSRLQKYIKLKDYIFICR